MKSFFHRVTIIGVGLIGGSFGLAIKRRYPSIKIVGLDKPSILERARRRGAISEGRSDLKKAVAESSLVVLCTPISTTIQFLPRIARYCSPNCVVTDVGSVKSPVVKLASKVFRDGNFVGGHPMAGSEKSGINAADASLFEESTWILTPDRKTNKRGLQKLKRFLSAIATRIVVMDPKTHDAVAAMISHVPQLIAVGLVNVGARKKAIHLAGKGFRDMTRIASSDFAMWKDILAQNRREVEQALRLLTKELTRYGRGLKSNALRAEFKKAKRLRRIIQKI